MTDDVATSTLRRRYVAGRIPKIAALKARVDELEGVAAYATTAIFLVIANRPENEAAPTNLALADIERRLRAALKQEQS